MKRNIYIINLIKNKLKKEKEEIRKSIKKIQEVSVAKKTSTTKKPMSMAAHNSMMQIQQMTFNTYMWSRGFNYLPATGKMW